MFLFSLLWVELGPTKILCWGSDPLETQDVTVFGARMLKELTEVKSDHLVVSLFRVTGIFIRSDLDR